ncbi:MAG: ATP-dependent sacrificial sulfur transferase LarE [Eubacterium sp.]|nr:ATP-dependent sacrificial sulfur transferase LarE [Eubacterium sp.]
MEELFLKYDELKGIISDLKSIAVAYSGGVDSTFLLHAANEALGENSVAIIAVSSLNPERETKEAVSFCEENNIKYVTLDFKALETEGFKENPPNKCYLCKKELFKNIVKEAEKLGMENIIEGSNKDDEGDYRPGMAALSELGIKSPLREAGFTKEEIRIISKSLGLFSWNKPSFACLASRIPYGELITEEKLLMIDKAENLLLSLGFNQFRVRMHSNLARIEVMPEQLGDILKDDIRLKIYEELKKLGFDYITLDLIGYRSGSLNETLTEKDMM